MVSQQLFDRARWLIGTYNRECGSGRARETYALATGVLYILTEEGGDVLYDSRCAALRVGSQYEAIPAGNICRRLSIPREARSANDAFTFAREELYLTPCSAQWVNWPINLTNED